MKMHTGIVPGGNKKVYTTNDAIALLLKAYLACQEFLMIKLIAPKFSHLKTTLKLFTSNHCRGDHPF